MLPAGSVSTTVRFPPAAIAACNSAAVVLPKLNVTLVSPARMLASVVKSVEPKNNEAMPPVAEPAVIVAEAVILVFVLFKVFATTVPPTGVTVSEVGVAGAVVSTTIALLVASAPAVPEVMPGKVSGELFPAASLMVPPLRIKAEVDC